MLAQLIERQELRLTAVPAVLLHELEEVGVRGRQSAAGAPAYRGRPPELARDIAEFVNVCAGRQFRAQGVCRDSGARASPCYDQPQVRPELGNASSGAQGLQSYDLVRARRI